MRMLTDEEDMQNRKSMKIYGALALCAALIALVFWTGALDRQKTWTEMVWSGLTFENGTSRELAKGDSYGAVNSGPGFTLPAGRYRLKWMIEADGDNRIAISCANGAEILPAVIPTSKDLVTDEYVFEIREAAENVQLCVRFESGTRINVLDMRLYSPIYRDHAFTFAFLLLGAWVLYALHASGRLTAKRRGTLLLLAFSVLIVSAPALKDSVGIGHDTTFHLVRLCNLADGLRHGQFPVRLGGYSYNGYGAVTSVFYPDLFLYLPALMMNAGASLQYAVNVFFVLVNAVSCAAMYVSAKRMFGCRDTALCAAVLYTFSIYRISDVFTRYAFGEMTAMAFLPLFILGLWEVTLGDKTRWRMLALSASAIFMSHMLSTLICAAAAVGVGMLFIVKIIRERRLISIVKAACSAGLLCLFYLVPFLVYSMQGLGAQSLAKDPALYAISPAQLFLLGEGELSIDPLDPTLSTFALEIGFPLLLGALLAAYIAAAAGKEERADGGMKLALLYGAAGMLFAWMSTTLFPWSYVRVLTRGLTDYLQFPWRMLMMTAVLLAFAGGWAYMRFAGEHREKAAVLVLALCAMASLPTLSDETRNNVFIPFGQTVSPDLQYVEYTIPGTKTAPTRDRSVKIQGDAALKDYVKESASITAHVTAQTESTIALPLFGYDGYAVTLDGEEVYWYRGENNRLTVAVPAGTDAQLEARYEGNRLFRLADGVSVLFAAAMAVFSLRRRMKR